MVRYWSDETYNEFYHSSPAEKGLVNKSGGDGDVDASGLKEPSRKQVENFQASFAEWSGGRGGIRSIDFRAFLLQIGVELSTAHTKGLWEENVASDAKLIGYHEALLAYRHVLTCPCEFKIPTGAAPPGRRAKSPVDDSIGETLYMKARKPLVSTHGRRQERQEGSEIGLSMCLPIPEARELLLTEGLPCVAVEDFLREFCDRGAVPQTHLFDFLMTQSGAFEKNEDLAALPSEPALPAEPERLRPPPRSVADAPRAPPVLS